MSSSPVNERLSFSQTYLCFSSVPINISLNLCLWTSFIKVFLLVPHLLYRIIISIILSFSQFSLDLCVPLPVWLPVVLFVSWFLYSVDIGYDSKINYFVGRIIIPYFLYFVAVWFHLSLFWYSFCNFCYFFSSILLIFQYYIQVNSIWT